MNKFFPLLALLVCAGLARGQTSGNKEVPPPSLPLKVSVGTAWERTAYVLPNASALENEDWSAIFKGSPRKNGRETVPPGGASSPNVAREVTPVPLRIGGIFQGGKSRESLAWSDGKKTEKWAINGFILEENVVDGAIMVTDPRFNPEQARLFSESPFTELFWLRPAFYQGLRSIQGKVYHYYRAVIPEQASVAGDEFLTAGLAAWIDVVTGLPFASTDEDSLWIYRYESPSTQPLVLPERFETALKESDARYRRIIGRYKAAKP